MSRPTWWTTVPMAALGAALFLHLPTARAQDHEFNDVNGLLGAASGDLVFTPVVPCRIIDTRVEGGRLTAGTPRDFDVAGALGSQGGAPNCGVPEGPATAVALNFVAVAPVGNGNMRAWPFGQPVPTASIINYTTGVNIANGVVIGICDPAVALCGKDFVVRADVSDTHLVVDVMGYFTRVGPVASTVPWSEVTGKPAGFADDVDNDTQYTAGTGLTLAGTNFSTNPLLTQSRVTGTCAAGSSIRTIDQSGLVTCEPDDNATILAGTGLTLTGSTLSVDFNLAQRRVAGSCPAGQSIRLIDAVGAVTCEPDDNSTYTGSLGVTLTGTNFTADTAFLQRRVATSCPAGQSIRAIDAAGIVTCELDSDTTYGGSAGVTLIGTTFTADTAFVQRRVATSCPAGQSIRVIDAAGTVTCQPDTNNIYTAGFGLNLAGPAFSVDPAEVQRRVSAACPSGIASMNEAGVANCAPLIQSGRESPVLCNATTPVLFATAFTGPIPSVTLTPQGLAGTPQPPNSYCVVDDVTRDGFRFCCFGHLTEQVSWIAMTTTQ